MKKIIAAVLSLCIAAGITAGYDAGLNIGEPVCAEATYVDENGREYTLDMDDDKVFIYRIYSDHAEVSSFSLTKETGYDAVIPEEFKGLKVTGLSRFIDSNADTLFIPKTITYIGDDVVLPDQLKSITVDEDNPNFSSENGILYNKDKTELICRPAKLDEEKYTVPASVEKINDHALQGSTRIQEYAVDPDNAYFSAVDGVLFSKDMTKLIRYPNHKTDVNYIVPDTVTEIGYKAFNYNRELKTVQLPDTLSVLRAYAFEDCAFMESLNIPESTVEIGDGILCNCSSLVTVTLPANMKSIGNETFSGCKELVSVDIPESVESIGDYAFVSCEKLSLSELPSVLTHIGERAFAWCTELTTVDIPDSVTEIGDGAFMHCDNLTEISLPASLGYLGFYTFCSCKSLEKIDIPASVTKIGEEVFVYCDNLKSIVIPDTVNEVNMNSFNYCNALEALTIMNADCKLSGYKIQKKRLKDGMPDREANYEYYDFDGIIYGHAGSTAQTYAQRNNLYFTSLDGSVVLTPSSPTATPTQRPSVKSLTPRTTSVPSAASTPTTVPAPGSPETSPEPADATPVPAVTPSDDTSSSVLGDVNKDNVITAADLTALIKHIIGGTGDEASDLNTDSKTDAADAAVLIKILKQ